MFILAVKNLAVPSSLLFFSPELNSILHHGFVQVYYLH